MVFLLEIGKITADRPYSRKRGTSGKDSMQFNNSNEKKYASSQGSEVICNRKIADVFEFACQQHLEKKKKESGNGR